MSRPTAMSARRRSRSSSATRPTSRSSSRSRCSASGANRVHRVAADEQGRMRADALRETLAGIDGPTLVCAQSGNVNTGAFDPLPEIVEAVRATPNAWLHVDGAFGLWAAAVPGASRSRRGPRGRGLVDHRCTQVAQRALRLGDRDRSGRGRASRVDDARRRVLRRDSGRRARSLQLGGRVVAPGPRLRGVRGAQVARAVRAWPR